MLMSEIEKMYKNANIKKHLAYFECHRGRSSMRCCPVSSDERDEGCSSCFFRDKMKEVYQYPPFTAEKQIELIKWISHHDGCFKVYLNSIEFGDSGFGSCSTFEESLAKAVSNFLRSATEKEKQQIKEILK